MPRSLKCQFRWLGGLAAGRFQFVNKIKESHFCHAKEIKNHCKHQLVTSTAWNDEKIKQLPYSLLLFSLREKGKLVPPSNIYQLSFGGKNFSCAFTFSTFASSSLPAPFHSNHFHGPKYTHTCMLSNTLLFLRLRGDAMEKQPLEK